MAGYSKFGMGLVAAAVAVVMLQATIVSGARPVKLKSSSCPGADEYVYPFWSFCVSPASLGTPYHYVSASTSLGGLEPEWDESNSTYYVRLTGDFASKGATYEAVVDSTSSSSSDTLPLNSGVYIVNADSGRALQWRQEGTDEFFLIELEVTNITEAALFRFVRADDVMLPCPLIYPPAQCFAYYIVSDPPSSNYTDAGLLTFTEGDATYVKAAPSGSVGDLPFLVIRSSTTTVMPLSKIRTVTA